MITNPTETNTLSPRQLIAMLQARQGLIFSVAIGVFLVTLIISLFLPRIWSSSSDIYIDYRENDPIAAQRLSAMLDDSYMQTQLDLLKSQRVAETVIDNLKLRGTPWYRSAVQDNGEERAEQQLVSRLIDNLEIRRLKGSRVVTVEFSGRSPQEARDYADAIVMAYIQLGEQMSFTAARSRFEQYNAQLEQLRTDVDEVQSKLTAYQQEHDILNVQEHGDQETQRLNEFNKTLIALQNELQQAYADRDATQRLLKSGLKPEELPMVNDATIINTLKSQLGFVDRQLGDKQGALGPNHPTIRGLTAERNKLTSRIAQEAQAIVSGQENTIDRLKEQINELEKTIAAQRKTVLAQMQQRNEISAMQRQLASAQQVYTSALQKYDTLIMASNVMSPNVTVLRPAELPTVASKPNVKVNLVLGLIVGVGLALVLALLLELLHRRVRVVEDMQGDPDLPLLGHIGFRETLV